MTIHESMPRIAGIHYDDGKLAAAWLALDPQTDRLRVYDCAVFRNESLEIVGLGLNKRGTWLPIAWPLTAKSIADKLLREQRCRMIPEAVNDDPQSTEMASREIWARMRTARLTVNESLADLQAEFESFRRDETGVPPGFPLMGAIRNAVSQLSYARREPLPGKGRPNFPNIRVV